MSKQSKTQRRMDGHQSVFSLSRGSQFVALMVLLMVAGCGGRADKLTSEESKVFEGASQEVRQTWEKALVADGNNDYMSAHNMFETLKQMQLSPQQRQALEKKVGIFERQLWQAAEKNEPSAVKAVQQINQSRPRK